MKGRVIVTFLTSIAVLSIGVSGCSTKTKDRIETISSDSNISKDGADIVIDDNSEAVTDIEPSIVVENNTKGEDTEPKLGEIKLTADNPVKYPFVNGSVHDPSVIFDNGTYYVFGSHLAAAKTDDLMNWTMIGSGVTSTNPIIKNVRDEMKEALTWAKTDTFWAPDVIQLLDGRYYMYYCTCEGSSPLSSLGVAVADVVEGPYKNLGIILKSGMGSGTKSEDGNTYNATVHPNVIDPCLFFDKEGKLWMVYGSYSGGIYILEMDPNTGFPLASGYGKKLLGGNHVRIEAPYIIFSKETDYYYLFLTFGGLDSIGGYNMRVVRSKTPDGPYYDSNGVDIYECKGPSGTFFNDKAIEPYGVKLMGNYRFAWVEGEQSKIRTGYVSPGHNSAYYNEATGEYYLIFHTRFEAKGESHEIRVHQMYMNEDDWPVVSPYRYVDTMEARNLVEKVYSMDDMVGYYKYINHGKGITKDVVISELIQFCEDKTVRGAVEGTWELKEVNYIELVLDDISYKGVTSIQWDEYGKKNVITFSAVSDTGVSIWGSGLEALE